MDHTTTGAISGNDGMKNFDPKVVKLKKKMKVVVAPGAFDGLIGADKGDE